MSPTTPATFQSANRNLPKRGAATKAAAAFVDQLASSSPVHEPEATGPGTASTAGMYSDESELSSLSDEGEEGNVEIAANGKGKGKEKDADAFDSGDSSLNSDSDHDGPFTPRKSAQTDSPIQSQSASMIGIGIGRPGPAVGIKTYGGRSRATRLHAKQPRTPQVATSSHLLEASPLTPLSSSSPRKKRVLSFAHQNSSSPSKRKRRSDIGTKDDYLPSNGVPSKRRLTNGFANDPVQGISIAATKGRSGEQIQSKASLSSLSDTRPRSHSSPVKPDVWSLDSLGTLIWVRVDHKNTPTEDPSKEAFWWPAKIEHVDRAEKLLRAGLYFPPIPRSPSFVRVTIKNPSSESVLSQLGPLSQQRFTLTNFRSSPSSGPSKSSSLANDYNSITARWEKAYRKMLGDEAIMDDNFPSLRAVISQVSKRDSSEGGERRTNNMKVSTALSKGKVRVEASLSETEKEPWSPPPPDTHVSIPGELLLAKEKKSKRMFWPAKVMSYVPPESQKMRARYLVRFLDNTEYEITRDMFYTCEQEEFATCEMGKFNSAEALHGEDGHDDLGPDLLSKTAGQLSIPEPILPAPPPSEFSGLPMLEQMSYIIPILTKVLQNAYKPAEQRNSQFLKGGRQRLMLSKDVPPKGSLTRQEYNQLAHIVKCWALGLSAPGDTMQVDNEQEGNNPDEAIGRPPSPPNLHRGRPETPSQHDGSVLGVTEEVSRDGEAIATPHTNGNGNRTSATESSPLSLPSSLPPSSLPTSTIADELPSDTAKPDTDDDPDFNRGGDVTTDPVQVTVNPDFDNGPSATSPSFHDLSKHEKIHYCTDILLEEAVIQLLLWRSGERLSPFLLADTEEENLHNRGSIKANDFDFVHSVLSIRETMQKRINARHSLKPQSSVKGTRSRPQNNK
ncbi:hypothetical protein DFH11DRAFT_1151960 [Phellopilus nigrolimitatus]|nr:hypothetical protein DFH11DRAFT_1151960 [Phellopilus nigrolimitatus]